MSYYNSKNKSFRPWLHFIERKTKLLSAIHSFFSIYFSFFSLFFSIFYFFSNFANFSLVILIKYILFYKNIFNKNNEAQICEILRIL